MGRGHPLQRLDGALCLVFLDEAEDADEDENDPDDDGIDVFPQECRNEGGGNEYPYHDAVELLEEERERGDCFRFLDFIWPVPGKAQLRVAGREAFRRAAERSQGVIGGPRMERSSHRYSLSRISCSGMPPFCSGLFGALRRLRWSMKYCRQSRPQKLAFFLKSSGPKTIV